MPAPQQRSIWPLIKEMFFNQKEVSDYIKRNKLITTLLAIDLFLFIMLLFSTEQAVQMEHKLQVANQKIISNEAISCKAQENSIYDDYRMVNRALEKCMAKPDNPKPPKKPDSNRHSLPAIVPREHYNAHDLQNKLDKIR